MFSVRLVVADHYVASPMPGLDPGDPTLGDPSTRSPSVPVIRIFGSTFEGQRTCLHIHGVFPYLFVPRNGLGEHEEPADGILSRMANSIDRALNVALGRPCANTRHVFKILLVSGRPFYGYHDEEKEFLKIYLYNPSMVKRVSELLQGGAVMNKTFQPHEGHIPFLLQFFIDYNLSGMNMVHLAAVKFRRIADRGDATLDADKQGAPSEQGVSKLPDSQNRLWTKVTIDSSQWLGEDVLRQSVCELEVDAIAADILNRTDNATLHGNPGLQALWDDEKQRRRDRNESSQIGDPPSPEREVVEICESENKYLNEIREILRTSSVVDNKENNLPSQERAKTPAFSVEALHASSSQERSSFQAVGDETVVDDDAIRTVVENSQHFGSPVVSTQHTDVAIDDSLVSLLAELNNDIMSQSQCLDNQQAVGTTVCPGLLPYKANSDEEESQPLCAQEDLELSLQMSDCWDEPPRTEFPTEAEQVGSSDGKGGRICPIIPQLDGSSDEPPKNRAQNRLSKTKKKKKKKLHIEWIPKSRQAPLPAFQLVHHMLDVDTQAMPSSLTQMHNQSFGHSFANDSLDFMRHDNIGYKRSVEVEPRSAEVEPRSTEVKQRSADMEPRSTVGLPGCSFLELKSAEVKLISAEVEPISAEVEPRSTVGLPGVGLVQGTQICAEGHQRGQKSQNDNLNESDEFVSMTREKRKRICNTLQPHVLLFDYRKAIGTCQSGVTKECIKKPVSYGQCKGRCATQRIGQKANAFTPANSKAANLVPKSDVLFPRGTRMYVKLRKLTDRCLSDAMGKSPSQSCRSTNKKSSQVLDVTADEACSSSKAKTTLEDISGLEKKGDSLVPFSESPYTTEQQSFSLSTTRSDLSNFRHDEGMSVEHCGMCRDGLSMDVMQTFKAPVSQDVFTLKQQSIEEGPVDETLQQRTEEEPMDEMLHLHISTEHAEENKPSMELTMELFPSTTPSPMSRNPSISELSADLSGCRSPTFLRAAEEQRCPRWRLRGCVLRPCLCPPSRDSVQHSLPTMDLSETVTYQEPFVSNPADLPTRPRGVCARSLKLTCRVNSCLPQHESELTARGLGHWCAVLSMLGELQRSQSSAQPNTSTTNVLPKCNPQRKTRHGAYTVITPCKHPPSRRRVAVWLQAKQNYEEMQRGLEMGKFPCAGEKTKNGCSIKLTTPPAERHVVKENTLNATDNPSVAPCGIPAPSLVATALSPIATALSPIATALSPIATALSPIATTLSPVATAPSPVGTAPSPVGTAPSPVGTAPSPVGTAPSPVGTAPSPVGTAPSPVGTAPSPVATTPSPVGMAPSAVASSISLQQRLYHLQASTSPALYDRDLQSVAATDTITRTSLQSNSFTPQPLFDNKAPTPERSLFAGFAPVEELWRHSTPCISVEVAAGSQRLNQRKKRDQRRLTSPLSGLSGTEKKVPKCLRQILVNTKLKKRIDSRNKSSNETSQLEGPSLDNTYGFKISQQDIHNAKSVHTVYHIRLLSLEVHVRNRLEMHPDPMVDPVLAVCYCMHEDRNGLPPNADGMFGAFAVSDSASGAGMMGRGRMGLEVLEVLSEEQLFADLQGLVLRFDPDILLGYEVQTTSWGFLLERAAVLGLDFCQKISRLAESSKENHFAREQDEFGAESMSEIHIAGRIVLNVWRMMKTEVALRVYSFENVAFHVLHQRLPHYSFHQLTLWWNTPSLLSRWKVLEYLRCRVCGNVQLLHNLDLVGRTSELARLFGIQFYHVLTRGSQYRVESMMLRAAKARNLISVSPSVVQRAKQRAPECLPLVMEPESRLYTSPVLVLDFQSLYPSIIIAYNYCFSTCLGRIEHLGKMAEFPFGCTSLTVPVQLLQRLQGRITVSPNGVAFVKATVCKGVLPSMLWDILQTRLMVKRSLSERSTDRALVRLLQARQLGLKLIANVTYGYTAANFSGRMPCIEVGDSIVQKARETLERAIKLVNDTSRWGARVVYGDTDSMFVLLHGASKDRAFKIGQEIADAVTAQNPKPVKLKFEKVYLPCVLQTKKRYMGYMYESPQQEQPVFDAKGIETVRRDGCPAVSKVLERTIQILFDTKDVSAVRMYVQRQCSKLLSGKSSLQDLIFAKEYRGLAAYRPSACVPALHIARKLLASDPRAEPRVGERVPYVIVNGPPGLPLIKLVERPLEVLSSPNLVPNVQYYVRKQLLPALQRVLSLIGVDVFSWYQVLPRVMRVPCRLRSMDEGSKSTIVHYFGTTRCAVCGETATDGLCSSCTRQPQRVAAVLMDQARKRERKYHHLLQLCRSCSGLAEWQPPCVSLDCPVTFALAGLEETSQDYQQFASLLN